MLPRSFPFLRDAVQIQRDKLDINTRKYFLIVGFRGLGVYRMGIGKQISTYASRGGLRNGTLTLCRADAFSQRGNRRANRVPSPFSLSTSIVPSMKVVRR